MACLIFWKKGVGHTNVVELAQFKESLTILIHFGYAVVTQDAKPCFLICAHPCIEVIQNVDML